MRIIVFTGAGISKESGLDTFRNGGMWDKVPVAEVATAHNWHGGDAASRDRMLQFYNARRRGVRAANPNGAHLALASLEQHGRRVTVITQNIDNLHERAGSSDVIHLHGEIMKVRPEDDESKVIDWEDDLELGMCVDDSQLRPHVVWFGEGLPEFERALEIATADDVDVLIVVGTTLAVGPANLCAFMTKAKTVYIVDPEPPEFGIKSSNWARESMTPHPDCRVFSESAVSGVRKVVDQILVSE